MYGNWQFGVSLTPPWNGITVEAQPAELVPGESATISLQPYETPAEEVMIPDQTWINVQTSLVGDLLGGLGLPAFGLRYFQGFARVPWGLLKGTDIVYEVLPDSALPVDFDSVQVPVVAYSPFDTGINGSTSIKVKKDECVTPPLYLQGGFNPRPSWADSTYDDTDTNIATLGCALSSMSMALTSQGFEITPGELNYWMKQRKFKDGGYLGNNVNWNAIQKFTDGKLSFQWKGKNMWVKKNDKNILNENGITDTSILDNLLKQCKLVIVQVYNQSTGNNHWVLVYGKESDKYLIKDPSPESKKYLNQYRNGDFWRYIVISKNS